MYTAREIPGKCTPTRGVVVVIDKVRNQTDQGKSSRPYALGREDARFFRTTGKLMFRKKKKKTCSEGIAPIIRNSKQRGAMLFQ